MKEMPKTKRAMVAMVPILLNLYIDRGVKTCCDCLVSRILSCATGLETCVQRENVRPEGDGRCAIVSREGATLKSNENTNGERRFELAAWQRTMHTRTGPLM